MSVQLTQSQIDELRQFRLTTEKTASPLSVNIDQLLEDHSMEKYLASVGCKINAESDKVSASIFAKRYAFLTVIYLYAMTAWEKKLNISFENLSIESDEKEGLWLPGICFASLGAEPAGNDKNEWRRECLTALFKDHMFPILDCMTRVTKISKLILWENIAVYIYWLYEKVFQREDIPAEMAERAQGDFQFILFQASGSLFGDYHENPLKRYYNEPVFIEKAGRVVRPRKTCCFSYLTNSRKRCVTCPQECKI